MFEMIDDHRKAAHSDDCDASLMQCHPGRREEISANRLLLSAPPLSPTTTTTSAKPLSAAVATTLLPQRTSRRPIARGWPTATATVATNAAMVAKWIILISCISAVALVAVIAVVAGRADGGPSRGAASPIIMKTPWQKRVGGEGCRVAHSFSQRKRASTSTRAYLFHRHASRGRPSLLLFAAANDLVFEVDNVPGPGVSLDTAIDLRIFGWDTDATSTDPSPTLSDTFFFMLGSQAQCPASNPTGAPEAKVTAVVPASKESRATMVVSAAAYGFTSGNAYIMCYRSRYQNQNQLVRARRGFTDEVPFAILVPVFSGFTVTPVMSALVTAGAGPLTATLAETILAATARAANSFTLSPIALLYLPVIGKTTDFDETATQCATAAQRAGAALLNQTSLSLVGSASPSGQHTVSFVAPLLASSTYHVCARYVDKDSSKAAWCVVRGIQVTVKELHPAFYTTTPAQPRAGQYINVVMTAAASVAGGFPASFPGRWKIVSGAASCATLPPPQLADMSLENPNVTLGATSATATGSVTDTGTVAKTGLLCYSQSPTLNVWNPIYRSATLPLTTTTTTGDFVLQYIQPSAAGLSLGSNTRVAEPVTLTIRGATLLDTLSAPNDRAFISVASSTSTTCSAAENLCSSLPPATITSTTTMFTCTPLTRINDSAVQCTATAELATSGAAAFCVCYQEATSLKYVTVPTPVQLQPRHPTDFRLNAAPVYGGQVVTLSLTSGGPSFTSNDALRFVATSALCSDDAAASLMSASISYRRTGEIGRAHV